MTSVIIPASPGENTETIVNPYDPYPKQMIFHSCPARHILYGGAVGGGKSDALISELHETLMDVEARGYADKVLMVRRTFPELQENIDRARDMIGSLATYRASEKRFVYRNGSIFQFGHIQHDEDVYAYKSAQFLKIAFDEETSFTEFIRTYMQTRNRSKTPGVVGGIIGGTNPGDIGHLAVLEYYVMPDQAICDRLLAYWPIEKSEPLWLQAQEEFPLAVGEDKRPTLNRYRELLKEHKIDWTPYPPGTTGQPKPFDVWLPKETPQMREVNDAREARGLPRLKPPTRCFIPSWLSDNPSLSLDGEYEALLLSNADRGNILTLYRGDWLNVKGQAFPEFKKTIEVDTPDGPRERPWHVVEPTIPPAHWPHWRAIDWGYSAPLCVLWFAMNPETGQVIVYRELYETGLRDGEVCKRILGMTTEDEPILITAVDPKSFWANTSNDDGLKLHEIYEQNGIPVTKAQNDRIMGKRRIHDMLSRDLEHDAPRMVITEDCVNLIRTLPQLMLDENNPEDIDERGEDHAYDTLRYGLLAKPGAAGRSRGLVISGKNRALYREGMFPDGVRRDGASNRQLGRVKIIQRG